MVHEYHTEQCWFQNIFIFGCYMRQQKCFLKITNVTMLRSWLVQIMQSQDSFLFWNMLLNFPLYSFNILSTRIICYIQGTKYLISRFIFNTFPSRPYTTAITPSRITSSILSWDLTLLNYYVWNAHNSRSSRCKIE